jgi:hypothetical protein
MVAAITATGGRHRALHRHPHNCRCIEVSQLDGGVVLVQQQDAGVLNLFKLSYVCKRNLMRKFSY